MTVNTRYAKGRHWRIELISADLFKQKLEYLHYDRVNASLCESQEGHYYSSSRFYQDALDAFKMLKYFTGN